MPFSTSSGFKRGQPTSACLFSLLDELPDAAAWGQAPAGILGVIRIVVLIRVLLGMI
jgi:Protein of unknown function (DUF3309)